MIPLIVFLLACVAVYLGVIEAAFSALMRLSLRLVAERSDRPDALGAYLDDPLLLFVPVRAISRNASWSNPMRRITLNKRISFARRSRIFFTIASGAMG